MANKRGPLSKAEIFYIEEHAKINKDIAEVAQDLDRTVAGIKECYEKTQKNLDNFNVGSQFARHKGSVVMTENASMMSDETKKKTNKTNPYKQCITKIK